MKVIMVYPLGNNLQHHHFREFDPRGYPYYLRMIDRYAYQHYVDTTGHPYLLIENEPI